MNGLTVVETEVLQALIVKLDRVEKLFTDTAAQLKETKKPYLTAQEVMEVTGFGKSWLNDNKQNIGFSTVGGCLRFKRSDVEAFMSTNYFKTKAPRRNN
jgi:hypothetical protein